jgi:hypothetical protein
MRGRIFVAMSSVVAATLVGCSTAQEGQPIGPSNTSTEQTTSPASEDQTYGAPRVSNSLDASRFLTRPCDVLSQTQLTSFGVSRLGKPDTDSQIAKQVGPGCTWNADPEVNSTIGVGFLTGNKRGLSDTYRGRSQFDYFDETTVDGYPAVFADGTDGRPAGRCNITVGISDTLAFSASEQGGRKGQDSCDRAKQVAAAVIATLKG